MPILGTCIDISQFWLQSHVPRDLSFYVQAKNFEFSKDFKFRNFAKFSIFENRLPFRDFLKFWKMPFTMKLGRSLTITSFKDFPKFQNFHVVLNLSLEGSFKKHKISLPDIYLRIFDPKRCFQIGNQKLKYIRCAQNFDPTHGLACMVDLK